MNHALWEKAKETKDKKTQIKKKEKKTEAQKIRVFKKIPSLSKRDMNILKAIENEKNKKEGI